MIFLPFGKMTNGTLLCAFALAKAALVAAYFMHLRFEARTLGLIAVTPLAIATLLIFVILPDSFAVITRPPRRSRRPQRRRRSTDPAWTWSGACSMAADAALTRIIRAEQRALALPCPRCGGTPLFRGLVRDDVVCAACDLRFERAQGYWVGAIYVNYGVTVVIAVGGFFLLWELARTGDRRAAVRSGCRSCSCSRCGSSATAAASGWPSSTG